MKVAPEIHFVTGEIKLYSKSLKMHHSLVLIILNLNVVEITVVMIAYGHKHMSIVWIK